MMKLIDDKMTCCWQWYASSPKCILLIAKAGAVSLMQQFLGNMRDSEVLNMREL